jgi:predicted RNase H-like HicB family nuclease
MTKTIDKVQVRNNINVMLSILVFQEEHLFVAYCPSLDMSAYGESIEEAKNNFDEITRLYIDQCSQNGTLKQDLLQHGWVMSGHNSINLPEQIDMDISAGLLKKQFNQNWTIPI